MLGGDDSYFARYLQEEYQYIITGKPGWRFLYPHFK